MNAVLLLALVAATAQAVSYFDLVNQEWTLFKLRHGKVYQSEFEDRLRKKIFSENMVKIAKHNARFEKRLTKFKMALNHLSDMFPHEHAMLHGLRPRTNVTKLVGSTFIAPSNVVLPEHVDWRQLGAVTPVKNQGQCGSCWAFSATGSLEGQHFRKTGKLVPLSEQNLVDCSTEYGNDGCYGGMIDYAFQYIMMNGGIDTEKSYPYEAMDDQCRFRKTSVGAVVSGFQGIPAGDEEMLKAVVATRGPVSAIIDAHQSSFYQYQTGQYYEPDCSESLPTHAVLVVGYGTTEEGDDYWIVKNSWGEKWGEGGYIRMARHKGNNCGIASHASFPLV